ncbi:MAG: hypothetical protein V3T17_10105 [Pseudomonadales bacterium]
MDENDIIELPPGIRAELKTVMAVIMEQKTTPPTFNHQAKQINRKIDHYRGEIIAPTPSPFHRNCILVILYEIIGFNHLFEKISIGYPLHITHHRIH